MRFGSGPETSGVGGLRWWRRGASLGALVVLIAAAAVSQAPVSHASMVATMKVWTLTWQDGFNSPADLQKWTAESGGGRGARLKQLQWYDQGSVIIGGGYLALTASKGGGSHHCWYGRCKYRSGRVNTFTSFAQKYGRFEARIKFPAGRGLWPAFWLEGANIAKVGWPKAGEIDIVEPNGVNAYQVRAYAHAYKWGVFRSYKLPHPLSAGYHVYGVDWSSTQIRWWVDGHTYGTVKAYKGWPFNKPFFIILNLAVGGGYAGPPTASTHFPARLLVDWVRVYK